MWPQSQSMGRRSRSIRRVCTILFFRIQIIYKIIRYSMFSPAFTLFFLYAHTWVLVKLTRKSALLTICNIHIFVRNVNPHQIPHISQHSEPTNHFFRLWDFFFLQHYSICRWPWQKAWNARKRPTIRVALCRNKKIYIWKRKITKSTLEN